MQRILSSILLLFLSTVALTVPVTAATTLPLCPVITSMGGSTVDYESEECEQPTEDESPTSPAAEKRSGDSPSKEAQKQAKSGPRIRYIAKYSTHCQAQQSGKNSCIDFDEPPCPNGDPLITRSIVALDGPQQGQTVAMDSYCTREPRAVVPGATDAEPEQISLEQRPVVITPAQFGSFPIKPSALKSQPTGFSLRNGNAHMYAVSDTQEFQTELQSRRVAVRAVPDSYSWNYGDGNHRKTKSPGKPMPNHTFDETTDTSHIYASTGDFQIRLSTAYRGEFSVEGGPWIPIPGTANVPSDPMPMSVWRTKKLLVDQNCAEDPDGPACDSPFLKEKSTSK